MINLLFVLCTLSAAASVFGGDLTVVRVGWTRDATIGPLPVAAAMGAFLAEGLDVHFELFDSDARIQGSVASGAVDIGVTTVTASYFEFAASHDLKIIASYTGDQAGYPGNTLVIAQTAYDAGLRAWKDLPGRRIGITSPRSGLHYAVAQLAKKYDFDLRSLRLVWLETPAKVMAALAQGKIDAAFVPGVEALRRRSSSKRTTLRWIGDEVPWQETVLFTSGPMISNHRALIEKFARAYQRGASEYDQTFLQRDDERDTIKGEHYEEYLALITRHSRAPSELRPYLVPWSDRLARLDVADIQNQLDFWQAQKMVNGSISAEALLDLSFISTHIGKLR